VTAITSRVLLVDDDPTICTAYDAILSSKGYEVTTAGSRAAALTQLGRLDASIDVLILDLSLPDADGAQVGREIAERIGQRPTLYVSGWNEEFWDLTDAPGRWLAMQKPVPILRLIEALDWLAGKRATRPEGA
jgi:CheY-like chemotaxis protein